MRVYIPGTIADLALQTSGRWEPQEAFAVTDELRAAAPDLDDEELAELAIDYAADESAFSRNSPLRVVIAADFSRADVQSDSSRGIAAVSLAGKLAPSAVACVFLDEDEAGPDIELARTGDEEARERVDERFLSWFDLGELAELQDRE